MTSIYVGNLSYDATEEDIRQAFAQHGEVASVSIVTYRETGRSRGFAFVEMPDDSAAQNAIETLGGQEFNGRAIVVREAKPRQERPRRNFGNDDRNY